MPEEEKLKALLGLHNPMLSDSYENYLGRKYNITLVNSVEGMLEEMGINSDSQPDALPKNHFDLYIMDINLGFPGAHICNSGLAIYYHVRTLKEEGKIEFVAISGADEAIAEGKKAGIPCKKTSGINLRDYL